MTITATENVLHPPSAYKSDLKPIWCPGCGDFGVLNALYKAMSMCNVEPEATAIVSGIGCSSRLPGFVNAYGYHGVHGRALPVATGIKIARPELTVIAVAGDGDAYSIGAGHLPHTARRNPDLTYLIMNNNTYGLTKGQVSPTSSIPLAHAGTKLDAKRWKTTPYGNTEDHINPMALAIALDVSFVARAFSYQPNQLADILVRAIRHKGFALIDVLSPCPTWNQDQTEAYYKESTFAIPDYHDPTDRVRAFELAFRTDGRIPLGVIYWRPDKPSQLDELAYLRERLGGRSTLESLFQRYASAEV